MDEELSEAQVAELKQALLDLRDELKEQLARTTESSKPVDLEQPIGRLSRMDALQQQAMASAAKHSSALRLKQIAAALAAIDSGDYGLCRSCEEPIGHRRLRARPETPLCLRCQSASESRRRR